MRQVGLDEDGFIEREGDFATAKAPGVQVDLAAFSVNTNANGTVSITVRQMTDPAALRQTLVKAGIPAIVSVVRLPQPICGNQATAYQPVTAKGVLVTKNSSRVSASTSITIQPAAIPKGASVDFTILMKGPIRP